MFYGVLEADAGENTKLTFGALYQHKDEVLDPTGLVLGKNLNDLHLPRDTFLGADWNKGKFDKTNIFAEVEHYFNDDWRWTNKFAYTYNKSNQEFATLASRQNNRDGDYNARIGILSQYKGSSNLYDFSSNLTGKFSTLGRSHDVFLTYSYSKEKGHMRNIDAKKNTNLVFDVRTFRPNNITYPDWGNMGWDGLSNTLIVTNMLSGGVRFNPLNNVHILAGGSYTKFKSHYIENAQNYNTNKPYTENTLTYQNHFTPYLEYYS